MSNVFISYKSDEFDEACWVKDKLEDSGISCWMAPMSIHGGTSYAEEIPKAIRECSFFVLILSEKVQKSKWVPRELDQAINNGKTILPFMIVDCSLKDDFDFYLSNVQRYEAFKDKEGELKRLIQDIYKALNSDAKDSSDDVGESIPSEKPTEDGLTDVTKPLPDESCNKTFDAHKKNKNKKLKNKKVSEKTNGKKLKKPLVILGCIALLIVVLVSAISLYDASNTVWICNNEYKKDDSYLRIENCAVTNEDIINMAELDDINTIVFKKCHLKGIDLNRVLKLVSHSVTFDECSITNEDIANLNVENKQLSQIIFDNNPQLTDLSVLSNYAESLKSISFNNCSVSDLSFVKNLVNLTSLSANKNNITDISDLKYCKHLNKLVLSNNNISSLDAIKDLTEIKSIDISRNQIFELSALEKLIYIEEFNASGNKITDISGLSNVTQLKTVDLSNNGITDVSVLAKSSMTLKKINISKNKVVDISSIAVCNFVSEFIADNNELTSVFALKTWSELTKVDVSNNQIADVKALSSCFKLNYVDLSDNLITSVDSLDFTQGESREVYLDISNNKITSVNIEPFQCSGLIIYGNDISDLSFVNGMLIIKKFVFDYNEEINFEALKGVDIWDFYVLNCPMDKQVYVSSTLGAYSTKFTLEETTEI